MILPNKYLHPLIYIIADAPTEQNIRKDIPLVGTQSYKTLLSWIADMDLDITRIRLYNQCDGPFDHALARTTLNTAIGAGQIKAVALGKKAATYLSNVGIEEFFILPHPSLRNRILNDKKFLNNKLNQCKLYVYQGVLNGNKELAQGIEEDLREEQELQTDDGSYKLE